MRRGEIAREQRVEVDGLLTEDQLDRLRKQAELGLDLRGKEHELNMRIAREQYGLRQEQRDDRYRYELGRTVNEGDVVERRWHQAFDRRERRDLHSLRVADGWARIGRRALALGAGATTLYLCVKAGFGPSDLWP